MGEPVWLLHAFGHDCLLVMAVVLGIPLGMIAALKRNTIVDYVTLFVSTHRRFGA